MEVICTVDNRQYYAEVVIEPDDGGFHAFCPSLKGLHTCGKTEEEARENSRDAVTAYIKSLVKHNEVVPLHSKELIMV